MVSPVHATFANIRDATAGLVKAVLNAFQLEQGSSQLWGYAQLWECPEYFECLASIREASMPMYAAFDALTMSSNILKFHSDSNAGLATLCHQRPHGRHDQGHGGGLQSVRQR
jgi:hypothetical protein